ncbi:MAG TPA: cyclic nucleotide-binding domain-containing protein [Solirubrobacteraceae bacterium]
MRTIEALIAATPLFAGLEPGHLELIAGCARNDHAEGGTLLLREGEPAEHFYLIREGAVALEVHSPGHGSIVIETLHAGDVVGWSWLFAPYRWQLDGRVLELTRLVVFDGACLRNKCEADHELGYQLMRRFAGNLVDRLQATRLQLLDVYGHAVTG